MQWHGRDIPMPLDWALTPDGEETDDPNAAMAGALLGIGTYKGYGLAFMTDVLTGVIGGGGFGLTPMPTRAGSMSAVHTLTAIDIEWFMPLETFRAPDGGTVRHGEVPRASARLHRRAAARRAGGARAARKSQAGVPLDAEVLADLRALAAEIGIDAESSTPPVGGCPVTPLAPAFRAMLRDRLRARAEAAGLDGLWRSATSPMSGSGRSR